MARSELSYSLGGTGKQQHHKSYSKDDNDVRHVREVKIGTINVIDGNLIEDRNIDAIFFSLFGTEKG